MIMPSSLKAFPLAMVLIAPQPIMIGVVKASSMSRVKFIKIEAKTTSLYLTIFIEFDLLVYKI
jgi:hypothetical protein